MSEQFIMGAFNAAVAAFSTTNSIGVAYENVDTSFGPSTPYLRASLVPATTRAAGCGTAAANRHNGEFQIDVFYPAGQGWGNCFAMAEKVRAAFKRGTKLDSGKVVIRNASFGPSFTDDVRYRVVVSIAYYATYAN